jgi:hypothetical protein
MAISNPWWEDSDDREICWLEVVTGKSPGQFLRTVDHDRATGRDLIAFIRPGDVVFHWTKRKGITCWSVATSEAFRSDDWEGMRVDLGPIHHLTVPVTLADIRENSGALRQARPNVQGAVYLPFTNIDDPNGILSIGQGYLSKMPLAMARVLMPEFEGLDLPAGLVEDVARAAGLEWTFEHLPESPARDYSRRNSVRAMDGLYSLAAELDAFAALCERWGGEGQLSRVDDGQFSEPTALRIRSRNPRRTESDHGVAATLRSQLSEPLARLVEEMT